MDAREHVREHFLTTRRLTDYLKLFADPDRRLLQWQIV